VLIERKRHNYLEGYTKNYTPVHILSENTELCGKIYDVKITKSYDDYCEGILL
jgi:threonylcarbamoyladenosine tRNA methylthiotransferase MtaB